MYVQPLDGSLTPNIAAPFGGAETEGTIFGGAGAPAAGDAISRFAPPWSGDGAVTASYGGGYGGFGPLQSLLGPLMGVMQQLMQMLQSLMGCGSPYGNGGGSQYGNGSCSPYGNERYFQNATGSSDGDPHLSFNGENLFLVAYKEWPQRSIIRRGRANGRTYSDDNHDSTANPAGRRKRRKRSCDGRRSRTRLR